MREAVSASAKTRYIPLVASVSNIEHKRSSFNRLRTSDVLRQAQDERCPSTGSIRAVF